MVLHQRSNHRLPSVGFPFGIDQQTDAVEFGPALDHQSLQKLLVNVEGKRILELGCANGATSVALTNAGAKVISVDPSADQLIRARQLTEANGARVEFHEGDLADLAFVRADTIDACIAIYSLAEVPEISRVFRQVHRVLRRDSIFLISLPHPVIHMTSLNERGVPEVTTTYPPKQSQPWDHAGQKRESRLYSISETFTSLTRCNFRVDALLEPLPVASDEDNALHAHEARGWLPETVIFRARKTGR